MTEALSFRGIARDDIDDLAALVADAFVGYRVITPADWKPPGADEQLEAVAPADSDLTREHQLIAELRDALAITDERLVGLGYAAEQLLELEA